MGCHATAFRLFVTVGTTSSCTPFRHIAGRNGAHLARLGQKTRSTLVEAAIADYRGVTLCGDTLVKMEAFKSIVYSRPLY